MCLSKWLNLLRTAQFKTALSAEKTSNVDFKKSLQCTTSRQRHENALFNVLVKNGNTVQETPGNTGLELC